MKDKRKRVGCRGFQEKEKRAVKDGGRKERLVRKVERFSRDLRSEREKVLVLFVAWRSEEEGAVIFVEATHGFLFSWASICNHLCTS